MGQDETIKVIGAIVVAVLVIALAVFIVGRSSSDADTISDAATSNIGTISGSITELAE